MEEMFQFIPGASNLLISHERKATLADRNFHLFLAPDSAAALPVALPGDTVGCGGVHSLPLTSESQIKDEDSGSSHVLGGGVSGCWVISNSRALTTGLTSGCGGDLEISGWNQRLAF